MLATAAHAQDHDDWNHSQEFRHVLLLSMDGMHAVDYKLHARDCGRERRGSILSEPSDAGQTGINYVATSSKPSDSFPGLAALVTGGSPKRPAFIMTSLTTARSMGRRSRPALAWLRRHARRLEYRRERRPTTNRESSIDDTKLNGGAPGAGLTEGGIASIDPKKLSRDPAAGCAPVYPWNFVRTNTIFSVVHEAGGYTAWIDKHASYSFTAGPGGKGLDDYYSPEVDSNVWRCLA